MLLRAPFNASLTISREEFAGFDRPEPKMIADLPLLSMLRTRMQWHQERQRVLAENVANADTAGFQPRDLAPPVISGIGARTALASMARTDPSHITTTQNSTQFASGASATGTIRRTGSNGVNLEEEMMRVAENQMDYQAVTSLYSRSLGLLKLALSRR